LQLNPVTGSITELAYALENGWDSEIWTKMFSCWTKAFSGE